MEQRVLIVKVTRRNCFLLYILYLKVKKDHSVARIYQLFYFDIFNKHVFIEKIQMINMEFPLLEACLPAYSFVDIDIIMPVSTAVFDIFQPLSCDVFVECYS